MNNIGRIISVNKTNWLVLYDNKNYLGIINNSYESLSLPVVGDYVYLTIDTYNNCIIKSIYKRKNYISKLSVDRSNEIYKRGNKQILASNIDIIFIVTSLNNDFNIARLERMVLVGIHSKSKIAFILTKSDLCNKEEIEYYKKILTDRFPNYPVFILSMYDKTSIDEIKSIWKENETAVLIGSSGVGKSTIINNLLNKYQIKTNDIRISDDKGKHTTTSRNLYILNDNRVIIDEPGIRSVALENNNEINNIFDKINELSLLCKYKTCTHVNSDGCAVNAAIKKGILTEEELKRYNKLKYNSSNKDKIKKDKINYYKNKKKVKKNI